MKGGLQVEQVELVLKIDRDKITFFNGNRKNVLAEIKNIFSYSADAKGWASLIALSISTNETLRKFLQPYSVLLTLTQYVKTEENQ